MQRTNKHADAVRALSRRGGCLSLMAGVWMVFSACFAQATTDYLALPTGVYQLDKTHASLTFKVSHLGLSNYTARFTDFDAALYFHSQNPEKSRMTATVNPLSIETDYPHPEREDFDKKLALGAQWFNARAFPEILFETTTIEMTGENTGILNGTLTFLGIKKPVMLKARLNGAMPAHPFLKKPVLGFSAQGIVKRSDFGMDIYVPNIGDDVTVIIEAEFIAKGD